MLVQVGDHGGDHGICPGKGGKGKADIQASDQRNGLLGGSSWEVSWEERRLQAGGTDVPQSTWDKIHGVTSPPCWLGVGEEVMGKSRRD